MTGQTIKQAPPARRAKPVKSDKHARYKNNAGRICHGVRGEGSKQAQLVALLSRKGGARVSLICERLGWQAHTVRAAVSGLRKKGFGIETAKATAPKNAKTSSGSGETIYAIVASAGTTDASFGEDAQ